MPPGRASSLKTKLARALHDRGLSNTDLSAATGITVESLENYTRGHQRITPRKLARIAFALSMDPADLYEEPT